MARPYLLAFLTLLLPCVYGAAGGSSNASTQSLPPDISSAATAPRLLYFAVRSGDRPVGLSPPFSPGHYIYQAVLDFYSDGFSIDALPANGGQIANAGELETTKLVPAGTQQKVDVRVTSGETDSAISMIYSVTVRRRTGFEIQLANLTAQGARISPVFAPEITEYIVHMPPELDVLDFRVALLDAGQSLVAHAHAEENLPSPAPSQTPAPQATQQTQSTAGASGGANDNLQPQVPVVPSSSSTSTSSARRLQSALVSGEVQRAVLHRRFQVGLGRSRRIDLQVKAANGDANSNRTYSFAASRAPCPAFRPLFSPDAGACTVTCNVGRFANARSKRCEACAERCLRCTSWDGCQRCEPSVLRELRFIYMDSGHCRILQIPWLQILLGSAVSAVVASCVACCVCGCLPAKRRGKPMVRRKRHGKYDEVEGVESHRLLDGAAEGGSDRSDVE